MEANGTRLHLLLGHDDWGRCREEGAAVTLGSLWPESGIADGADAAWDPENAEVRLRPKPFRFEQAGEAALALSARRGAGVDRFGTWFWISEDRSEIRASSAGSRTTAVFWRPGIGQPRRPARRRGEFARRDLPPGSEGLAGALLGGLAVTADHHLVAGLLAPKGLLVFDLQGGGAPLRFAWPEAVPFTPFDMSPRRHGGVFVLDADERRLWELDRHFLIVSIGPARARAGRPSAFGPVGGATPQPWSAVAGAIQLDDAAPLTGEPIAIEAARDGTVLVLDRNGAAAHSLLRRYRNGAELGMPVALAGLGVDVSAYDMALAGADLGALAAPLGRLYVVAATGNQAYSFRLSVPDDALTATALEDYFPLRSFGGKALVSDGRLAYYDFADRFVGLAAQARPRFVPEVVLVTPPFDGGEPDCVWHRLLLDGCAPPQTAVEVSSRAADDARDLAATDWRLEPAPQRRPEGSELPFVADPGEPRGTWELLFQHARGRHLQLRLRLTGDERTSPRLRALRAYYPRLSYLERYLPKLYREDDASASFLDRFLANAEGINTGIEDRIATAQLLLDPEATPSEYLDWLASWFELALAAGWDEHKRRLFVRNANRFLQLRGTARGLALALRLALEPCIDEEAFERPEAEVGGPRIVERFRTRLVPAAALGDPSTATGPRIVPSGRRWRPDDGGDALDERFRLAVQAARAAERPDPAIVFTAAPPAGELEPLWRSFAQSELGFVPAPGVETAWTAFLRERYGRIEALRTSYGLRGGDPATFDDMAVPEALPADGAPLRDWYQFQAVLVPMRRAAHAFSVLLPVPVGESTTSDHEARRALATRVVSLQKPAHTVFDVRFYWSAFRIGEARLGLDTVIDLGSRSPALLAPLVLGRGHVGEDVLGGDTAPVLTRPPSDTRRPLGR